MKKCYASKKKKSHKSLKAKAQEIVSLFSQQGLVELLKWNGCLSYEELINFIQMITMDHGITGSQMNCNIIQERQTGRCRWQEFV